MNKFIYTELAKAEFDLKLFSKLNMNEGRLLYLKSDADGFEITREQPATRMIVSIAIDGIIFA